MKRLPNNAVHKALLKFLKENQNTPAYDFVPPDACLPYITLGGITVSDKGTKSDDIVHVSVRIHIWSNYRGRYEINNIAERIINLLSSVQLDLSQDKFCVTAQGVDFYESYPEEESGYNGVLTFEIFIQNLERNEK